ncbi:MAG: YceI family protein [Caulobacterales bacterium]|jgi:polyisoprenoid-binding protein YceI
MKSGLLIAAAALVLAAGCTPTAPPAQDTATEAQVAAPVAITAPAGEYKLDKGHASLLFSVTHMGLSNYTLRFTDFDATLNFDPANVAASTVSATINPASIESDYVGDYRATHQGSPYRSWDEELQKDEKFLNVAANPTITFQSTGITVTGERTGTMTGNLTFLGQTHPVTLDVTFNGEAQPPWLGGRSAVGFSATGSFDRSQFGMTHLVPNISDAVQLTLEVEFQQVAAPAAPAAPAAATTP